MIHRGVSIHFILSLRKMACLRLQGSRGQNIAYFGLFLEEEEPEVDVDMGDLFGGDY